MPISSIFPQYHIMSVSRLPTVTLNTHWLKFTHAHKSHDSIHNIYIDHNLKYSIKNKFRSSFFCMCTSGCTMQSVLVWINTKIESIANCVHQIRHGDLGGMMVEIMDVWKKNRWWCKFIPSRFLSQIEPVHHQLREAMSYVGTGGLLGCIEA
jgi:hypothetical protein